MKNTICKAVLFDMDGVITDTMPYHFRAWRRIFLDNGLHVSRYDIYRREGQKGKESIREIFAEAGINISASKAQRIIADKEILFNRIIRHRYIPGSRTLIKALHRNGVRLALVTGTSRREMEKILPPALLSMFEIAVTGSDVHFGKPHPEPYLKALAALKITAAEGLVVENAPFGILSAKAAGIKCYAVSTSLPAKYLLNADMVFKDLTLLGKKLMNKLDR